MDSILAVNRSEAGRAFGPMGGAASTRNKFGAPFVSVGNVNVVFVPAAGSQFEYADHVAVFELP
jgi:hypothetical protein